MLMQLGVGFEDCLGFLVASKTYEAYHFDIFEREQVGMLLNALIQIIKERLWFGEVMGEGTKEQIPIGNREWASLKCTNGCIGRYFLCPFLMIDGVLGATLLERSEIVFQVEGALKQRFLKEGKQQKRDHGAPLATLPRMTGVSKRRNQALWKKRGACSFIMVSCLAESF